ncbi:MAG: DUF456 domain-containing protein [Actinomycetia bacterium]|jgi:hypothetical protein|nr:DUF456 domain-containing protein [Actinomycetes bacterium]
MSQAGEVLIALVMLVGLVGVVVPVLPGLFLVWGAGVVWALLDGGGWVRWTVVGVMTVLLALGTAAGYLLPGRAASGPAASSRWTLPWAAVGGVVGFFVIPVVGFIVGFVLGVLVAELVARRDLRTAWQATLEVLKATGLAMAIQLGAGLLMVLGWVAGVALT